MAWAARMGAMLVAPRAAFRALLHRNEGGIGDIIGLMFLFMLGSRPVETAQAFLSSSRGVMVTLAKLVDQFVYFALAPLVITLALGLVLAGILRVRGSRVPLDGVMTAAVYLWVPVGALGLLGAWMSELGWPHPFLPHVSLAAYLAAEPPLWQLALRFVLSYSWSAGLLWVLWGTLGEAPPASAEVKKTLALPRWPGWLLLGLLAGSWVSGGIYAAVHYDRIRPVMPGDPAPELRLPRADGQGQVVLSALRGKPIVVEFWADWCKVCIQNIPRLQAWHEAHPDIPYLAIHQGGDAQTVKDFLAAHPWPGPIFAVDADSRASLAYRVDSLPSFFIIAPDGSIAAAHVGSLPDHWLDHQLGLGHAGHDH